MLKILGVGLSVALGVSLGAVACGPSGLSEGGSCGGGQDDCGSNLTCQPVAGRKGDFCCPTPQQSSNYENCHPTAAEDQTPQ
jgi:hypothetical protein